MTRDVYFVMSCLDVGTCQAAAQAALRLERIGWHNGGYSARFSNPDFYRFDSLGPISTSIKVTEIVLKSYFTLLIEF